MTNEPFIQLTKPGGANMLVNKNYISEVHPDHVNHDGRRSDAIVVMGNGNDYHIKETYEEIQAMLEVTTDDK